LSPQNLIGDPHESIAVHSLKVAGVQMKSLGFGHMFCLFLTPGHGSFLLEEIQSTPAKSGTFRLAADEEAV